MEPVAADGLVSGAAKTQQPPLPPPSPFPSEVFLQSLTSEINKEDVHNMVSAQRHMLSRFEKTVEMLLNFNVLSESRYLTTQQEFKQHTHLLTDMKKDLDSVFRRIRTLKETLKAQYPNAFKASCSDVYNLIEDEEEDEEDVTLTVSQATTPATPSACPVATTVTMTSSQEDAGGEMSGSESQPAAKDTSTENR